MRIKINHEQAMLLARSLEKKLKTVLGRHSSSYLTFYAVPRGGVPVGYLLSILSSTLRIVERPEEADVFIDDIIDSGATKNIMALKYPHTPFYALVDKSDKSSPYADKWVIFPWEKDESTEMDDTIVGTIKGRVQAAKGAFAANDNIAQYLAPGDLDLLEEEVARRAEKLLRGLVIDVDNDHNTGGSAKRLARMYLREVFKGRYLPPPTITDFPNIKKVDEIYVTGPITIRSACSHHFVPIMGRCWIGVIPGERVIGLSKFNRIIEWIAARPQIQEELAVQIADFLEAQVKPRGLAVIMEATHMCLTWRGVREPMEAQMVSSVMRGLFKTKPNAKAEFMGLIKR